LTKLIALLGVLSAAVGLNFVAMIYGWGVYPKSVTVIILCNVFGQAVMSKALETVMKGDK